MRMSLVGTAIAVGLSFFHLSPASAQTPPPLLGTGDVVVAGFAGTVAPDPAQPLPAGKSAIDLTFIDPDGISARIFDAAQPGYVWDGRVFDAPERFAVPARTIGQVFGVAIDDEPAPNVYLSATSAYGLNIVRRKADGTLERRKAGGPGTGWMPGQFGLDLLGGPGSIYKVDGATREVSLFAEVMLNGAANPGPALGNLAYDPAHRQLFVSDLYTGMVHRFAIDDGAELGAPYDHGVAGRTAGGLPAVPFDASMRPNIASAAFDAQDPASWDYAPAPRRVWGLAVHEGRLFYSVGDGSDGQPPQIWSVGLLEDGGFAGDPQWELDVSVERGAFAVSDIVFSARGAMILAQRAPVAGAYDYVALTRAGEPRVLRYWLEDPNDPATPSRWILEPEEYAIGFPNDYRNANGGVDLGYGYDEYGILRDGACEYSLWTTGQQLRNDPALRDRLEPNGPLAINGLQASPAWPVRDFNTPPDASYFIDFDRRTDDPDITGHLGGVRVLKAPCAAAVAYSQVPPYIYVIQPPVVIIETCPWPLNPDGSCGLVNVDCPWGTGADGECLPVVPDCVTNPDPKVCGDTEIDLALEKTAGSTVYDETLGQWTVTFTLNVTNAGNPFDPGSSIALHETVPAGITFVAASGADWSCSPALPLSSGPFNCSYAYGPGTFATGQALNPLTITATLGGTAGKYENCAVVGVAPGSGLGETALDNNKSCATVELDVDVAIEKTGAFAAGAGDMPAPGAGQTVAYTLTVTNVGGAFSGGNAISVSDPAPAGMTLTGVSATAATDWTCAIVSNAVACTYVGGGPAAPGEVLGTIAVTATAEGKGPWENCASVGVAPAGLETNLDDNKDCVTLTTPQYDVSLEKKFEQGAAADAGTYTLTVTNNGDEIASPAVAVTVTDAVPAGVTLTGVSGGSDWTCPSLPSAVVGPANLTCTYTGPAATFASGTTLPDLVLTATLAPAKPGSSEVGIYRNCASVGLSTPGGFPAEIDTANNTDCAVTTTINHDGDCAAGGCPTPEAVCRQDVLFIVDTSQSITNIGAVRSAVTAFLQAMQGTGGSVDIIGFNSGAIGTSNPSWTQVTSGGWQLVTPANAATLANGLAIPPAGGPAQFQNARTDWDDALRHGRDVVTAASPLGGAPLVIFITDGEPTAYIDDTTNLEVDSNATPVIASTQAVPWINAIRATGAPLIAVGYGAVASQGYLDAAFTGNSTGPGNVSLTGSQVIKMSDVSSLEGVLRTLSSQMCGTLALNKSVSEPYTGWFNIPAGGTSVAVNHPFTFTLTLTNGGAVAVNNIVVTDQVPSVLGGVTSASAGVSIDSANLLTWNIPTLGPNQQATATFTGNLSQTYTAPNYYTYTNYAQVAAADDYTATQLNDMNPVSGPVDEQDESSASFTVRVRNQPDNPCTGANQPASCYLSVIKYRTNPNAEDASCTSSPAGGAVNPCPFTIVVSSSSSTIPAGSTVTVSDTLTLDGTPVTWAGTVAPSLCNSGTPPSQISFLCSHAGMPGFSGTTTVQIPAGKQGELKNCVTVTIANATVTPPFSAAQTSCTTVTLTQPSGLVIQPTGDGGKQTPPPPKSVCRPPLVRTAKGTCACPTGTTLHGKECVIVVRKCPAGTELRGKECVRIVQACPTGTVRQGQACVPVVRECPKGTVRKGQDCVKPDGPKPIVCRLPAFPDRTGTACLCPKGFQAKDNGCVVVRSVTGDKEQRRPDPSPKENKGDKSRKAAD